MMKVFEKYHERLKRIPYRSCFNLERLLQSKILGDYLALLSGVKITPESVPQVGIRSYAFCVLVIDNANAAIKPLSLSSIATVCREVHLETIESTKSI